MPHADDLVVILVLADALAAAVTVIVLMETVLG